MRATFTHIVRYVGWALVGAAAGFALLLLWCERGEQYLVRPSSGFWVFAGGAGGFAFVLVRAIGGVVSGVERERADHLALVWLGRFVLGGVAGWLAADFVYGRVDLRVFLRLNDTGWWLLPLVLAGGFAGAATGWLAWWRHGKALLPASWLLVFALLVSGWLSLAKELVH